MNYHPKFVIGGNRGLSGGSSFAEPSLIVTDEQGVAAIVSTDSLAVPDRLANEDLAHSLQKHEAFKLIKSQEYRPGLTLWIFRRADRVFKEQIARLRACGALVHLETQEQTEILVIDGPRSIAPRDEWAATSYANAWSAASEGDWARALDSIELMWLVERHPTTIASAFHSLVLERMNRKAEADAILAVEANSGLHSLHELENTVTALAIRLGVNVGSEETKGKSRRSSKRSQPREDAGDGITLDLFRDDPRPAFSFDVDAPP